MRARLVRPEFWADSTVGKLPARTRLTYIGLWNVADDAGFFDWKPDDIAAALFRFESPRQRETHMDADMGRLADSGRIRRLGCGEHGFIPTLKEWGIQGGTHNERVRLTHEKCHVPTSTDKSRSVSLSESESVSLSGAVPPDGLSPVDEDELTYLRHAIATATEPALRLRFEAQLARKEQGRVH